MIVIAFRLGPLTENGALLTLVYLHFKLQVMMTITRGTSWGPEKAQCNGYRRN